MTRFRSTRSVRTPANGLTIRYGTVSTASVAPVPSDGQTARRPAWATQRSAAKGQAPP
jgi:hypothetical protein